MKLLPFVLAIIAGSVDIITFLGLNQLFTAHITGNLVILTAYIVAGNAASLALLISVPVFIVMLAATEILATALGGTLRLTTLLLLQLMLLGGFLGICVAAGPGVSANAPSMLLAGMLGVSAMAVQNALVRVGLVGAPSTAVLTTNITLLTVDVVAIMLAQDTGGISRARRRARRTWPAVAGFLLGCAVGGWCEAAMGLRALVVPAGVALIALALGSFTQPRQPV